MASPKRARDRRRRWLPLAEVKQALGVPLLTRCETVVLTKREPWFRGNAQLGECRQT
jgi:hypothetical protein